MANNASQMFLLADHIKLSLLERQRALSSNLEPYARDVEISTSLNLFRDGLNMLQNEHSVGPELHRLRLQYNELRQQFDTGILDTSSSLGRPNDTPLSADFAHANSAQPGHQSSSLSRSPGVATNKPKSVRFSVSNTTEPSDTDRNMLFPYKDDPEGFPDHGALDNRQIHAYHSRVLQEQDTQLDRLGESIGRQRELSIQIGDELDDQAEMLDDVDAHVDQHQSQLNRAKNRVGKVARKAKDNLSLTIIAILIMILVLLIIILK